MLTPNSCWTIVLTLLASACLDVEAERERGEWLCEQVEQIAEQRPGHNVIGFLEGLVRYNIAPPWPYGTRKISYPDRCEQVYTFHRTVGMCNVKTHPEGDFAVRAVRDVSPSLSLVPFLPLCQNFC